MVNIGIFQQFMARQPETIILKEHVFSLPGDSFSIRLADGTPILQVKGKVFSLRSRKKVRDMAGNHLFDIRKELLHIHTTFVIKDPRRLKIMKVKSSFAPLGSKATATFTSQNGKQESLQMKGNFFDTSAEIKDKTQGSLTVASINRKLLNGGELLFGQQTYNVRVEPGVDKALIAAMCICLDEKNNEGK
ncbi:hypothetical protein K458DRAFT_442255 [Lentithecium fluviatile CBS 122367]|uniref:DUF567-domain-containing protein n=1 Tax=Lentithecium fluviatile CBS 122367 TaxID=1168545 RepID=A0A6G1J498_9PLEO|nr:hypothetical protein K458DRAFT_442255 [Lentithecium fluviatile CBS 122367]